MTNLEERQKIRRCEMCGNPVIAQCELKPALFLPNEGALSATGCEWLLIDDLSVIEGS